MGVRELGNVLGNPLGRARSQGSGGGTDKAVVGDVIFASSAPDATWAQALGQNVFMDEYPDLLAAFGGVLPVTGFGNIDTNLADVLPKSTVNNLAIYGDNADTINGLTIASYRKISNTLTTVYFTTIKNGVVSAYTVDLIPSGSNYFTPGHLSFTPTGELMIAGYQNSSGSSASRTGYAYLLKKNGSGVYVINLSEIAITSGNSFTSNEFGRPESVNPSFLQFPGLYGPTQCFWYTGSALQNQNNGYIFNGPNYSYAQSAASGNGLTTIQSFRWMTTGSWNYVLEFQRRTSITSTNWTDISIYNESSVAYTAQTFYELNILSMWFNYDGTILYVQTSSGVVKVFEKVSGQDRYNYSRSFTVAGGTVCDFSADRYVLIPSGVTVRIFDSVTGDEFPVVDFSLHLNSVTKARLSANQNYLVAYGSAKAGSPYSGLQIVPALAPLTSRSQMKVPNLSGLPGQIASQYSPQVPRSVFMKMKP